MSISPSRRCILSLQDFVLVKMLEWSPTGTAALEATDLGRVLRYPSKTGSFIAFETFRMAPRVPYDRGGESSRMSPL